VLLRKSTSTSLGQTVTSLMIVIRNASVFSKPIISVCEGRFDINIILKLESFVSSKYCASLDNMRLRRQSALIVLIQFLVFPNWK
jgi:hypothetical protein